MKKSAFLFLFFLVSVADFASVYLNLRWLELVMKPLIVLSLIGYYFSRSTSRSRIFILALSFCWLGDVLLLFETAGKNNLVYGLLAFLLGQIFFIISYRLHSFVTSDSRWINLHKVRIAFPIILAGTGLVVLLYPTLGELRIPVLVYALILTAMVVTAILRMGKTKRGSYWLVLTGSLLFMASDSLLALNKFFMPLPNASLWIMLTYCGAQFFIVRGILAHPDSD